MFVPPMLSFEIGAGIAASLNLILICNPLAAWKTIDWKFTIVQANQNADISIVCFNILRELLRNQLIIRYLFCCQRIFIVNIPIRQPTDRRTKHPSIICVKIFNSNHLVIRWLRKSTRCKWTLRTKISHFRPPSFFANRTKSTVGIRYPMFFAYFFMKYTFPSRCTIRPSNPL